MLQSFMTRCHSIMRAAAAPMAAGRAGSAAGRASALGWGVVDGGIWGGVLRFRCVGV